MAHRRVFGKQLASQRDTFASMLHSSPDTRPEDTGAGYLKAGKGSMKEEIIAKQSPRRKKGSILQPVSGNVGLPQKRRSPVKKAAAKAVGAQEQEHRAREQRCMPVTETCQQKEPSETPSKPAENAKDAPRAATYPKAATGSTTKRFDDAVYSDHCQSLLDLCEQTIQDFAKWSAGLAEHLNITKIAEASYGEVYRLSMHDIPDESMIQHDESVLKVIALTPPDATLPKTKQARNKALKRASLMSKPQDVACELRLLQRMSTIPGFTDFREMTILKGRPPPAFTRAYKAYNKAQLAAHKDISTFPDPAKKSSYPEDQLWAVIEMKDAGTDLERLLDAGQCQDISSVWDIFWQVALALAKGEEAAQFEHRDLHLGNICIKTKQRSSRSRKLHYTDLDVTLIDYTISRASIDDGVAFMDLSKDEYIFNADSTHEYQYDIYRYMRSALYHDDPLAEFDDTTTSRSWLQYHPQTNLIWLHFVLYMLLEQATESAKRDKRLRKILLQVSELLDPESVISNGVTSSGILIATALNNGWLDEQDIVGVEETLILDDLVDNFAALSA